MRFATPAADARKALRDAAHPHCAYTMSIKSQTALFAAVWVLFALQLNADTLSFTIPWFATSSMVVPEEWRSGRITGTLRFESDPGLYPGPDEDSQIRIDWDGAELSLSNGLYHTGVALKVEYSSESWVRYCMNTGATNLMIDVWGDRCRVWAWGDNDGSSQWGVYTGWLDESVKLGP